MAKALLHFDMRFSCVYSKHAIFGGSCRSQPLDGEFFCERTPMLCIMVKAFAAPRRICAASKECPCHLLCFLSGLRSQQKEGTGKFLGSGSAVSPVCVREPHQILWYELRTACFLRSPDVHCDAQRPYFCNTKGDDPCEEVAEQLQVAGEHVHESINSPQVNLMRLGFMIRHCSCLSLCKPFVMPCS